MDCVQKGSILACFEPHKNTDKLLRKKPQSLICMIWSKHEAKPHNLLFFLCINEMFKLPFITLYLTDNHFVFLWTTILSLADIMREVFSSLKASISIECEDETFQLVWNILQMLLCKYFLYHKFFSNSHFPQIIT